MFVIKTTKKVDLIYKHIYICTVHTKIQHNENLLFIHAALLPNAAYHFYHSLLYPYKCRQNGHMNS